MKRIFTLLALFAFSLPAFSQLNMTLRDQIDYQDELNDIWGWADPDDGTEYALVGLTTGVSIVSLADLDDVQEVARIPGPNSTWRDLKTWKNYAYVSNETGDGILVIDLSKLPAEAPYEYWAPTIPDLGGQLSSVHNVFIDERGTLYMAGANLNAGGVIFVDVDSNPGQPEVVGWNEPVYSHDVYVRNGLAYDAQIYEGRMAIYDWNDVSNPQLLGSQITPFSFTHNTWLSDDGNVVFTTDERANAPVAAYDVSDVDDIQFLDEYRPVETVGKDVIPHNVHVWDDWLLISYYTDGGRVVDASRPTNLIEVGNFDTWLVTEGGFDGAWGLYPFLPSGTVLVSDIGNGLYVLTPNLVRACWLEGTVVEKGTGTPLNEVEVIINTAQPNLGTTNGSGEFETGIATAGTYDVTFFKPNYKKKTISVDLENGVLKEVTVELELLSKYQISGKVVRKSDGSPVSNAQVVVENDIYNISTTADIDGNYTLEAFEGTYNIIAGAWGYRHGAYVRDLNANISTTLELEEGYQDDFVLDLGWVGSADQTATSGFWIREEPIGTNSNGTLQNPELDLDFDLGTHCYMTGNGGGTAGTDDVDDGTVILTSPPMDLTRYNTPVLKFYRWLQNIDRRNNPRNDSLTVFADNGFDKIILLKTTELVEWTLTEINLKDYLEITDNMVISFEATDLDPGHVLEVAVDGFEIVEGNTSSNKDLLLNAEIEAFPNPFGTRLNFKYNLEESDAVLSVKNLLGQEVERQILNGTSGIVTLGSGWVPGIYLVRISKNEKESQVMKLVKQ